MALHRYDGVEQYFGRAYEFGYSFSVEETFAKWGREETLGDVVRVVRAFRPDVIVTLPLQGTGGGQHHQAVARLARDAFRAAADPARFPEQRRACRRGRPARSTRAASAASARCRGRRRVRVPTGVYDPLLGMTWQQLGIRSRAMHRCQGAGQLGADPGPGRRAASASLDAEPAVTAPETDILDGVDTTLAGLRATRARRRRRSARRSPRSTAQLAAARAAFDPGVAGSRRARARRGARRRCARSRRSSARSCADARARAEIDGRLAGRGGRRRGRARARPGPGARGARRRRARDARPVAGRRGGALQQRRAGARRRRRSSSRRPPAGRVERRDGEAGALAGGGVAPRPLHAHVAARDARPVAALLAPAAGPRPPRARSSPRTRRALEPARPRGPRARCRVAGVADDRARAGRLALRGRRSSAASGGTSCRSCRSSRCGSRPRSRRSRSRVRGGRWRSALRCAASRRAPPRPTCASRRPPGFTVEPPSARLAFAYEGEEAVRPLPGDAARVARAPARSRCARWRRATAASTASPSRRSTTTTSSAASCCARPRRACWCSTCARPQAPRSAT